MNRLLLRLCDLIEARSRTREILVSVRVELDGEVLGETVKRALIRDARRGAMGCHVTDVDHAPPPR